MPWADSYPNTHKHIQHPTYDDQPNKGYTSMALHCPCHCKSVFTWSWSIPPTKENGPVPTKQMENTPARKIIASHPTLSIPSTMGSSSPQLVIPTQTILWQPWTQSPQKKNARDGAQFACSAISPHHTLNQYTWFGQRRTRMAI